VKKGSNTKCRFSNTNFEHNAADRVKEQTIQSSLLNLLRLNAGYISSAIYRAVTPQGCIFTTLAVYPSGLSPFQAYRGAAFMFSNAPCILPTAMFVCVLIYAPSHIICQAPVMAGAILVGYYLNRSFTAIANVILNCGWLGSHSNKKSNISLTVCFLASLIASIASKLSVLIHAISAYLCAFNSSSFALWRNSHLSNHPQFSITFAMAVKERFK